MKTKFSLIVLCSFLTLILQASTTVPARMYCLSIRIYDGSNIYGDVLRVNSTGDATGDGELEAAQPPDNEITLPGATGYGSQVWIYASEYGAWWSGSIYLSPPYDPADPGLLADANHNRYPDFFEVSRGLSTFTTPGSYSYYDPQLGSFNGTISAVWSRTAGSKTGTCRMTLTDSQLGDYWGTMVSTFEIIEYKGTLTYTSGTTNVTGILSLTQTGSNATFTGSVEFVKSDTNRFDSLIIQPGILTDQNSTPCYYTNRYFFRDSNWPTNYGGYIQFDNDGNIGSFYPYMTWVLSIDDPNDTNGNGIPNFSDDASVVAPPSPPTLGLNVTGNTLLLSVTGTTQHTHQIQQTSSLDPTSWQDVGAPFVLTNSTVMVPVSPSGSSPTFWRVVAQ